MLNISEAASIALHSAIYLAKRGQSSHSLKEISEAFGVSPNHLSKVLQRLVKSGLIISTKGPNGGFQIKKGKERATLLEVYEAVEGKYSKKTCLFAAPRKGCRCVMKPMLNEINSAFETFMKGHKLQDLNL